MVVCCTRSELFWCFFRLVFTFIFLVQNKQQLKLPGMDNIRFTFKFKLQLVTAACPSSLNHNWIQFFKFFFSQKAENMLSRTCYWPFSCIDPKWKMEDGPFKEECCCFFFFFFFLVMNGLKSSFIQLFSLLAVPTLPPSTQLQCRAPPPPTHTSLAHINTQTPSLPPEAFGQEGVGFPNYLNRFQQMVEELSCTALQPTDQSFINPEPEHF